MMLFPNFIFMFILLFSIILAISSSSWFLVWLSLEMNTISFLTLIYNEKNKLSSESCFKYFFVQSISSSILIFFSQYIFNFNLSSFLISLALLIKLGAAPFHLWFVSVMQIIHWPSCFILSTLQKLIPLSLLLSNNFKFMNLFIVSSAILGSLGGLNQTNLKSLLAFSSISHIAWMLSTFNLSSLMFLIYLFLYTLLNLPIIILFNKYSLYSIKTMTNLPKRELIITFILMLSLGGFPPLLGFLPKWMMINSLINKSILISFVLILSSILNLYFYIRVSYTIILLSSSSISSNTFLSLVPSLPSLALSLSLFSLPLIPLIY